MSTVPTRRTTRTTRAPALSNENAINTRTTRTAALRAKPASKDVGATKGPTTTTAASRAKSAAPPSKAAPADGKESAAMTKRKREALGEVGGANVKPAKVPASKGKGKEVAAVVAAKADNVVIKAKVTAASVVVGPSSAATATTTTATTTTRAPIRVFGAPASRRTTRGSTAVPNDKAPAVIELEDVKEVPEDETENVAPPRKSDHMEIDAPAARRTSRKPQSSRPPVSRSIRRLAQPKEEEEDLEDHREHKKRRTSSEAGELERQQVEEELVVQEDELLTRQEELLLGPVEADPNGDDWEDLDQEDIDDPQMVSEYVAEIFEYLKEVEQTTMPNPNYMESQKELAWKMRGILTDWLIQVHFRFRLLPETLFLAVNIIDRFLSARVVSLAKLQLVGVACMFIAAKVEEIVAPSAANFLYCADSSYTEVEILQAEKYILKTLDWNLSYPNPMHFLRRVSKADEYNVQVRTIGKYLMEVSCLEWRLIAAPPSLLAAASIWLARIILGREEWTPNLAHYSSYAESSLLPTANMMLNYVLKPTAHQSFYKKYASKKYLKASMYVREWALERWEEGTRVDLAHELPQLKIWIREQNARDLAAAAAGELNGAADGEGTHLEDTYAEEAR